MTSLANVQPASSDFWKVPGVWGEAGSGFFSDKEVDICSGYNLPAVVVQPFFFIRNWRQHGRAGVDN